MARARGLKRHRNVARYLEIFLPLVFFLSATIAAALLLLRSLGAGVEFLWTIYAAALLATGVASWFVARTKFLHLADALVRLEEVGRLHNRLTAANAGVGEWPQPAKVREPVRWRWSRLLGPFALSMILLMGAARLPVARARPHERFTEQPHAWTQLESWLQTIEEAKLVEPEAVGKIREQLDELRDHPAEDWYKQHSLEAGDTLRDQTEQALRTMLQQLEKTDQALAAAAKTGEASSPAQLKALSDQLQNSLHGLEMGNLPLNKEMLTDLKKLSASKLKQPSASQLSDMRAKVQAGARVAQQCVSPGANVKHALIEEKPGDGGPGGGGGPAPLALKQDPTNLRTKETDTVSNDDVSQALPADLVGLERGEHDVDTAQEVRSRAGGGIASAGEGGEAIRRESFTPEEREVLQRFFK